MTAASDAETGLPPAMMVPVRAITDFMRTLDARDLAGVFADDVVIVENFAPFVFRGPDAVAAWRSGFAGHARDGGLADLVIRFGRAQDFSQDGDRAFFTLPAKWTGTSQGRGFDEDGGWAFVLDRQGARWRVACYAWVVTAVRPL